MNINKASRRANHPGEAKLRFCGTDYAATRILRKFAQECLDTTQGLPGSAERPAKVGVAASLGSGHELLQHAGQCATHRRASLPSCRKRARQLLLNRKFSDATGTLAPALVNSHISPETGE